MTNLINFRLSAVNQTCQTLLKTVSKPRYIDGYAAFIKSRFDRGCFSYGYNTYLNFLKKTDWTVKRNVLSFICKIKLNVFML